MSMNTDMKQNTDNRYIEKDGRAYRWTGKHVYALYNSTDDRLLDPEEAKQIVMLGAEVSERRAMRITAIVEGHRDYVDSEAVSSATDETILPTDES